MKLVVLLSRNQYFLEVYRGHFDLYQSANIKNLKIEEIYFVESYTNKIFAMAEVSNVRPVFRDETGIKFLSHYRFMFESFYDHEEISKVALEHLWSHISPETHTWVIVSGTPVTRVTQSGMCVYKVINNQ